MEVEKTLIHGLTSSPKFIPTWYRFDRRGSQLHEERLQKSTYYYFHRFEKALLENVVQELIKRINIPCTLVDLGSGSSEKSRMFMDRILQVQKRLKYVPVDISKEFLLETCKNLSESYKDVLDIEPCAMDYHDAIKLLGKIDKNILLMCLGGSLQNCTYKEQVQLLSEVADNMEDEDYFLLSIDITQDKEQILDAYLDPDDFAGKFNLNSIQRLNREFRGNFDLNNFEIHREFLHNADDSQMSSVRVYVTAKEHQTYRLDTLDLDVSFYSGERLNLYEGEGTSHKYTKEQLKTLTKLSGLQMHNIWTNEHVALLLLRKSDV